MQNLASSLPSWNQSFWGVPSELFRFFFTNYSKFYRFCKFAIFSTKTIWLDIRNSILTFRDLFFYEIIWWACYDWLFLDIINFTISFSGRYSIWNLFLMAPAITTFLPCSHYLQACQSIWTYWDWRWFRFYILHQTAMGSLKHFRCSISKNRYLNHP